ncbi:MAG TPA: chemotaxis protein CheB, partial [Abditibacterium sp.]
SRDYPSQLAQILSRACPLPVSQATDEESIQPGHIYVARPDHHLVVEPERVRVTRGPSENRFRPSIDVLFRSAALSFGPRVIAVVLSGVLDDGTSGAYAVKQQGGLVIVQDPKDAFYGAMPRNVLKAVEVDHVLPVAEMGELLLSLVTQTPPEAEKPIVPPDLEIEVRIARQDHALGNDVMKLGTASYFTCPDCHGTLLQIQEGQRTRFRCHTGHAFSLDALLSAVTQNIEETLWSGVRALEESEMLLDHMAQHLEQAGEGEVAQPFVEQARRAKARAALVRQAALDSEVLSEEKIEPDNPPNRSD